MKRDRFFNPKSGVKHRWMGWMMFGEEKKGQIGLLCLSLNIYSIYIHINDCMYPFSRSEFIFSPNRSPMKCIGSIHDLGSHRRLMSVPWSGLVGHIKCGAQGLMLVGNRQKKPGSLRDDIWARHWKILGLSNFEHLWTMFRCTESGASLLTSTFTPVTLMTNTFNRTHQTCEIDDPIPPG